MKKSKDGSWSYRQEVKNIPLFEQYPPLGDRLPYVSLGEFPTPVHKLHKLGSDLGIGQLYIKRDDLSSEVYGGNKPRKLEFLLGNTLTENVKEVITFGCAGSNHALATAVYAQKMKLKCISMLLEQPNAQYVRRNLLWSYVCDAQLFHYKNKMKISKKFRNLQALRISINIKEKGINPKIDPLCKDV